MNFLNLFIESVHRFTTPAAKTVGDLKNVVWSTILGKNVQSYGLSSTGVAISFTDGTFVAAEFRNGACSTNLNFNPGCSYLNPAIIRAGIVTQEQIDEARQDMENRKRQIAQLQKELDARG